MNFLKNHLFSERRLCCLEYHLFKRYFHSIRLWAPDAFLQNSGRRSLLFFSNHVSSWDSFLDAPIIERYRLQTVFFIRNEKHLRKSHGEIGENNTKGGAAGANPSYFVYPHGQTCSNNGDWPAYSRQLAAFLENSPFPAFPMVKTIVHGRYTRPEAFIEIGQPLQPETIGKDGEANSNRFEKAHQRLYNKNLRRIAKRDYAGAILLLAPRKESAKVN